MIKEVENIGGKRCVYMYNVKLQIIFCNGKFFLRRI
jgi:hypothetical protein